MGRALGGNVEQFTVNTDYWNDFNNLLFVYEQHGMKGVTDYIRRKPVKTYAQKYRLEGPAQVALLDDLVLRINKLDGASTEAEYRACINEAHKIIYPERPPLYRENVQKLYAGVFKAA